jgi:hypothetical protein
MLGLLIAFAIAGFAQDTRTSLEVPFLNAGRVTRALIRTSVVVPFFASSSDQSGGVWCLSTL